MLDSLYNCFFLIHIQIPKERKKQTNKTRYPEWYPVFSLTFLTTAFPYNVLHCQYLLRCHYKLGEKERATERKTSALNQKKSEMQFNLYFVKASVEVSVRLITPTNRDNPRRD